MASVHYPVALTKMAEGDLDLEADTIKAILVMTNTTADTDTGADNVDAITTLDEMDGSGFTWGHGNTGRKTLSNITASDDGTTFTFDNTADITWSTLGAGTRSITGVLIAKEGTADDTTAIPICFLEVTDTAANGGDITIAFHASGILTIA